MRPRTLDWVTTCVGGSLLGGEPSLRATGARIDSREVHSGDLFFALSGRHVHGAEFIASAVDRGALAAVIAEDDLDIAASTGIPLIVVRDPARALQVLARAVRDDERENLPAVAITGSVGKTTTCLWASELISGSKSVHRPPKSFNNELGVPLTILGAPDGTEVIVNEVGTSAPGEIHRLGSWVRPDVAIVTAIAPAHLDGLGSIEGIEIEKLSLLDTLEPDGIGFVPADLAVRQRHLIRSLGVRVETIGPGGDIEVLSTDAGRHRLIVRGERIDFRWQPPLPHSARNLEAAIAAGIGLGLSARGLVERVGNLSLPPLRGGTEDHAGVTFHLDCYNANPASMHSALDRLEAATGRGRRLCVLGAMDELGDHAKKYHLEVGERLANSSVDRVCFVGETRDWYEEGLARAGDGDGRSFDLEAGRDLAEELGRQLEPGDTILFKASRTAELEGLARRVAELIDERIDKRSVKSA